MTNPVLQLEEYYLTRLSMDYKFPTGVQEITVASANAQFHYDVLTHAKDPRRRQLKLHVEFQERDDKDQPVGYHIVCDIVGFFSFTDATPKGKEEILIRVNGFNMLYGALRGMLGMITGLGPGGRFSVPNVMPNEIVKDIENRRRKTAQPQAAATTGTEASQKS